MPTAAYEIEIQSPNRRQACRGWTKGTIGAYRFQALVFSEHAEDSTYEIGRSRISKLWLQRITDRREVFNWDRGLDRPAIDADVQAAVDFLATNLAERIFTAN